MFGYDRPPHQIYMYFFRRGGWQVQFLEAGLKTPLPRKLMFTGPEKIRELARGGEAWGILDTKLALEHAIEMGRSGAYPEVDAALHAPGSCIAKAERLGAPFV
jgi:hypothetical protein